MGGEINKLNDRHYAKGDEMKGVHPIIRQIVDRDCHVGTPYRKVIRHVVSKLNGGWATFKGMPREDRRVFIIQCCSVHFENRDLYHYVMRG